MKIESNALRGLGDYWLQDGVQGECEVSWHTDKFLSSSPGQRRGSYWYRAIDSNVIAVENNQRDLFTS